MNVHVSFRADRRPEIENEITQQLDKLKKRMRVFRPELVHVHVNIEPGSSKKNGGISFSVNLRMPSGQLTATGIGQPPVAVIKDVFRDLTTQLNTHKDHLRNRRNFNRKTAPQVHGVPFEETLASMKAPEPNPQATDGDVRLFVNTNMENLERFIRRELRLRMAAGEISPNLVSIEEVLDETVANALDETAQHPDLMSIEQWLYHLALLSIDSVAKRNSSTGDVNIEEQRGTQNVSGTDDSYLQFHQPDEELYAGDFIPDQTRSDPEEIIYSRESIEQVGGALACLDKNDRDAFVLYAFEGFEVHDIARIAQRSEHEITQSLHNARMALDKQLSPDNAYRALLRRAVPA